MRWLLVLVTSVAAHAGAVKCRGRCVLLARPKDTAAPLVYVDELGLVEGVDLKVLATECDALAALRSENPAGGFVVETLSIAPKGGVKIVVDHQVKTTCDHDVNAPLITNDSFAVLSRGVLEVALHWVAAFFGANASHL